MKKTTPRKMKNLKHNYYLAVLILILIPIFVILFQNPVNMTNFRQDFPTNNEQKIKSNPIHSLDPDDFLYYKDIIIDDSKVTGSHSDFPILISLLDSDLQDYAHENGYDIVFYSITDSLWLEHEVEYYEQYYTPTEAKLIAWIKVPTVSESGSSVIRMYFGNSDITSTEENPEEVWNDYRGVWHLSDDPTGTIEDSTTNYDGTSQGTMATTNSIGGIISDAITFDGSNDYLDFGDIALQTNDMTLSFWMNADQRRTMSCIDKFPYDEGLLEPAGFSVRLQSDGDLEFVLGNEGLIGGVDSITASSAYSGLTWVHVTCTYDISTGRAYIYINGNQATTGTITGIGYIDNNNVRLRFGSPYVVAYYNRFDGALDEVRISNFAQSANWIMTEYTNQHEPEQFYSVGPLEGFGLYTPNVIITSPLDSNFYDPPSLTIRATITDDETFITDAIATITGGSTPVDIAMSKVSTEIWECSWDFSGIFYPAQEYTITITAHDNEGFINNTEYVTVTIQKDLTAPIINFVNPIDGTSVGDPFAITATIIDSADNDPGDGDVFATIKYGGIALFNLNLDRIGGTNNWTAEWSNLTLPDYQLGDYTIDITAKDTSYYQNEQTIGSRTITLIDTHAPIVMIDSIYSGPYGQYQSYKEIEIKATITDSKSSVEQAIAIISGPETLNLAMNLNEDKWTCLWDNITAYTNGNYKITIWTIDGAGNINQQESVTVSIINLQYVSSGDNGTPYLLIIGIIAFIGSVGSVGTYGMIRVKRHRNSAPKLDDKLLKLEKGIKRTELSLKEAKSSLKDSSLPQEDDIVREIKNIQHKMKNQTELTRTESKRIKGISKIRIQDEIMNSELNEKTKDEKLKIMKRKFKDIEDFY